MIIIPLIEIEGVYSNEYENWGYLQWIGGLEAYVLAWRS